MNCSPSTEIEQVTSAHVISTLALILTFYKGFVLHNLGLFKNTTDSMVHSLFKFVYIKLKIYF